MTNNIQKIEGGATVVACFNTLGDLNSSTNTWYRLYSDNWCEQGGWVTEAGTAPNTYSLPLKMQTIRYDLLLSGSRGASIKDSTIVAISPVGTRTKTSFDAYCTYITLSTISYGNFSFCWAAFGVAELD